MTTINHINNFHDEDIIYRNDYCYGNNDCSIMTQQD